MISASDRLNSIERARHAVMVEGSQATPWVQGWISDSWRRCIAQGLKPDDALSFNPVSTSHIKQALDQNRDLIQSAKPELERLGRAIAGTPFFALITDAQGVLLDLGGAIDRHDKRVSSIARVGVDLSERAVGTTAISAALTESSSPFTVTVMFAMVSSKRRFQAARPVTSFSCSRRSISSES